MFRDSRGVVHTVSSADPLLDLPPDAADALRAAILRVGEEDLGGALERCDAVHALLERWQEAFFAALPPEVDMAEEARWAAEAGLSLAEVEAGYEDDELEDDDLDIDDHEGDDGDLPGILVSLDADEEDPRELLPEELVTLLERELLLLPLRVRLEALVAAEGLVDAWADLLADQEKLLGHLVLAHGQPQDVLTQEALAGRHAGLHAQSGPGHPER